MKKIFLLLIPVLLLTGCQKCVESHQEDSRCTRCTYVRIGKTLHCIPHHYNCKKTICDKWEDN